MFRVNAMHIDIVIFNRYNHAVTWATRHFISLISIHKKYESTFKEISKLHLLVVIYECTSGQRKHSIIETIITPIVCQYKTRQLFAAAFASVAAGWCAVCSNRCRLSLVSV